MMRNTAVVITTLFTAFSQANAQICAGAANFSSGWMRLGADYAATGNTQSYGAEVAFGARSGWFATANAARLHFDNLSSGAVSGGAGGGFSVDLNPQHTLQFCPAVGYSFQSGPNVDEGLGTVNISANNFTFGGFLGGVAAGGPGFEWVPFVGGAYGMSRSTVNDRGTSNSVNSHRSVLSVGSGFVIKSVFTIQPAVSVPVGVSGGAIIYQLMFAINRGGR